MSLAPPWAEGPVVAGHALAALASVILGAAQFAAPKGTAWHRALGRVWVALMAGVALSSFAIFDLRLIGPFSPIHLLSVLVLASLVEAVRAARAGRIRQHRRVLVSLYCLGLILTGVFTLLPGRAMHAVLFGA